MIAIKGMEIPKSCSECQFKARESWWNAPYKKEEVKEWNAVNVGKRSIMY